MPTLTLSWTDVFLSLLTAGIIGGAAFAGSQIRSERSSDLSSSGSKNKSSKATKKKKSSQAKKNAPNASQLEDVPRSIPLIEISSPTLIPEVTNNNNNNNNKKKKKSSDSVTTVKTSLNKPSLGALDDEQEFPALGASVSEECSKPHSAPERPELKSAQRPFAERMQAPVRKTKVDDMIDEDVVQPMRMARVMKIVEESSDSSSAGGSDTEDGWEKVSDARKSRGGAKTMSLKMSSHTASAVGVTRPPGSANTTTGAASKRQRQNAKKKEAAKAAKAAEEAERIARLSTHKRQQEGVRMNEQANRPMTSQSSKSKEVGGGMKASIGGDGRLIWE